MADATHNDVKEQQQQVDDDDVVENNNTPINSFQQLLKAICNCLGLDFTWFDKGLYNKDDDGKAGGETTTQQLDSAVEQPTDEEPGSAVEQPTPTDEEQKGDETICEQPDSTAEQPVDPPITTTDPITDPQGGNVETQAAAGRRGRAPPRPGIVGSTPQTNDLPSL